MSSPQRNRRGRKKRRWKLNVKQFARFVITIILLVAVIVLMARCAAGVVGKVKGKDTKSQQTTTQQQKPAKSKSGKGKNVEITISATGDCTLGKDPASAYSTSFNGAFETHGADWFFKNVKSVFEKDDMTIVNFEGTLTQATTAANKTFTFKGEDEYLDVLTGSGVDFMSFANNHVYDYEEQGYQDTIDVFEENDVPYASFDKVGIYKVKGIKIGVVSVFGEDRNTLMKDGIRKLKEQKADLIIACMHCGAERVYYPADIQVDLAHLAVDEGADLVIGHHPHVLEGVEYYKGAFINYSLGNFCFGGNRNPSDMNTVIMQKTFKFKDGKLKKDEQLHIIPCSISSESSYNNYQPTIVEGTAKGNIISKMNQYSAGFNVKFDSDGDAEVTD